MRNIRNLVLIPLLCCSFFSLAQEKNEYTIIANAKESSLSFLDRKFFLPDKIPFKEIKVVDYRYDSSKICYLKTGAIPVGYNRIKPEENWSAILNNYFRKNLDSSSNNILFIVIRSFWMQEGIIDKISNKKVVTKEWLSNKHTGGACTIEIDIYIKSDSTFQPFFKIEDTFLNFYNFTYNKLDEWFFLPFDSVARKIISSDIDQILTTKKKLSESEVKAYYNNRFLTPVLTDTLIQKGIFLTFEDFKKNKPLNTEFRLKNGKVTDELYILNGKEESLITDFWGFYNGEKLFIKTGLNIFPAVRRQNTFEIFGAKYVTNNHNNPQPGELLRINSMKINKKILQLDMATGNFY